MDKTMMKFKIEAKRREIKEKVSNGVKNTLNWCTEHPEELALLVAAGGLAVKGVEKINKIHNRSVNARMEKAKTMRVYDPSTKVYVNLKRPLVEKDYMRIHDYRVIHGCNETEALVALGLVRTVNF